MPHGPFRHAELEVKSRQILDRERRGAEKANHTLELGFIAHGGGISAAVCSLGAPYARAGCLKGIDSSNSEQDSSDDLLCGT